MTSDDVIVDVQAIPGTSKNQEGLAPSVLPGAVVMAIPRTSENQEGSTPSVLPGAVVIGHSSEKPSEADAVLRWPSVFCGCSVVALCVLVVRRLDARSAAQETMRRGTSTGEYWRLCPR